MHYAYVYNNPLKYSDPSGYLSAMYENWDHYYAEKEQEYIQGSADADMKRMREVEDNLFYRSLTGRNLPEVNVRGGALENKSAFIRRVQYDLDHLDDNGGGGFGIVNFIPILGSASSYLDNMNSGNYWDAAADLSLYTIELFTLGAASEYAIASRAARVSAKAGGRAFFSGAGTEAKAIQQGYQTLGQTRAGQNLQNLITTKNIPWSQAEPMWQRLSATWANGIPNGSSVPVFLNNPRAGSVWFQTEFPILQKKGVKLLYK